MEIEILKVLKFDLGRPLSLHFLRRYSKAGDVTADHHTFAKMAMEAAFVEYRVAHVLPSKMSAAALLLALRTIDGWWTLAWARGGKSLGSKPRANHPYFFSFSVNKEIRKGL